MKIQQSQYLGKDKEGICSYGLPEFPTDKKWSGKNPPPLIGQEVEINFNQFGKGKVVAYFFEHGFAGCEVEVFIQPAWHLKQCGKNRHPLIFGIELR